MAQSTLGARDWQRQLAIVFCSDWAVLETFAYGIMLLISVYKPGNPQGKILQIAS